MKLSVPPTFALDADDTTTLFFRFNSTAEAEPLDQQLWNKETYEVSITNVTLKVILTGENSQTRIITISTATVSVAVIVIVFLVI